jgi:hypothetical protein
MSTQEERYQIVLSQLHGDMAELKTSAYKLAEENLVLRAQVTRFSKRFPFMVFVLNRLMILSLCFRQLNSIYFSWLLK